MPESTLALSYPALKSEAGLFLGYGRGVPDDRAWTTRQSSLLDSVVQSGLRQFYYPMPMDQGGQSYEWSFLRPTRTLALAADAQTLPLPDDFGGFEGQLSLTNADGDVGYPLELTGIGRVRQMRANFPDNTGRPILAAVDPEKVSGAGGQRWVLEVYPAADEAFTITCSYYLHPDALSGSRPHAYGGPVHAETIRAAIIAAAELTLDNKRGERWAYFQERLATSISQDRKLKPQVLGYNGDNSNMIHAGLDPRDRRFINRVTVNGVQY